MNHFVTRVQKADTYIVFQASLDSRNHDQDLLWVGYHQVSYWKISLRSVSVLEYTIAYRRTRQKRLQLIGQ